MKKIILAILICLSMATSIFAADLKTGDPSYSAKTFANSEGVTDDYIYAVERIEKYIDHNTPLLMINGSFDLNTQIIISDGIAYISLGDTAKLFEVDVTYDPDKYKAAVSSSITGKITFELPDESLSTGSVSAQADPALKIFNHSAYIPLRFICENLEYSVGYLPKSSYAEIGIGKNPVIWIEKSDVTDNMPIDETEATSSLKNILSNSLNFLENTDHSDYLETIISSIEEDIENTKCMGTAGRYYLYKLDRTVILSDAYTGSIYYYVDGHLYSYLGLLDKESGTLLLVTYFLG